MSQPRPWFSQYSFRRTRAGLFRLEDACTLDAVQQAADEGRAETLLRRVDTLFDEPELRMDARAERLLRCGGQPRTDRADGRWRVYGASGKFLALGRIEDGRLVTIKSFFEV